MEPARSRLVTASPVEPAGGVAGWLGVAEGGGEQPLYLVDRQRDQPGVGGRPVSRAGRRRSLGIGAVPPGSRRHEGAAELLVPSFQIDQKAGNPDCQSSTAGG